jgi:hypothetical protein
VLLQQRFRFPRRAFSIPYDKRDLRLSLEWDAVLHGKMTYEVIEEGPESAVVLVTESNDFFRLLKLDGQKLRVKFIVKGETRFQLTVSCASCFRPNCVSE